MTKEQVLDCVLSIVKDKLGADFVHESDKLIDFGCDSLDFIEIVMEAEKQCKATIPDEHVGEWEHLTVENLAEIVYKDIPR